MSLPAKLERYFISDDVRMDPYLFYRHKLVLNSSILTSLFSLLYLFVSLLIEFRPGVYLMVFNVVGFLALPYLMFTRMSIRILGNIYVLTGTVAVVVVIFFSGGVHSPVFPWLIAPPVLALLITGRANSMIWTVIVLGCLGTMMFMEGSGFRFPVSYNTEWSLFFKLLCSVGIILIIGVIVLIFENNTARALNEVASQKMALQESNEILSAHREELMTTSEQLKELNEKKDYLMEILAHDLKSPLANIQALIGLVKADAFAAESLERNVIDLIRDSSHRSQLLIQKILNSENLENIIYNVNLEQTDVAMLLSKAVDDLQSTAFEKTIRIQFSAADDSSHTAWVDKIYLTQIFENLINNAIKFSPKEKNIYVSISQTDKHIRAAIRDEGPGIAQEEMGMLFKKFKKLSNRPTGGESSTGLGLSIVKHYTGLLKGRVWCESERGKGATFIVELNR
jgi:signal transduction histidine kinase